MIFAYCAHLFIKDQKNLKCDSGLVIELFYAWHVKCYENMQSFFEGDVSGDILFFITKFFVDSLLRIFQKLMFCVL